MVSSIINEKIFEGGSGLDCIERWEGENTLNEELAGDFQPLKARLTGC